MKFSKFTLPKEGSALVIVDMQERLAVVMAKDQLQIAIKSITALIECAHLLKIPVIELRQYPKGLGDTLPEIKGKLLTDDPIDKTDFSGLAVLELDMRLKGINNVIICGMETHICVLQTAIDMLQTGINVHVVADGCVSREPNNKQCGLDYLRQAGATITNYETVLFQLIKTAESEHFKIISNLVK